MVRTPGERACLIVLCALDGGNSPPRELLPPLRGTCVPWHCLSHVTHEIRPRDSYPCPPSPQMTSTPPSSASQRPSSTTPRPPSSTGTEVQTTAEDGVSTECTSLLPLPSPALPYSASQLAAQVGPQGRKEHRPHPFLTRFKRVFSYTVTVPRHEAQV